MTSADLVRTMADRLRDTKLVVVANRQPYVHEKQVTERTGLRRWLLRQGDKVSINWKQPASGLVTALDPVMRACGGTWVAHGNGSGDLESSDPSGRVAVPPDKPKYSLRRVFLKQQEESGRSEEHTSELQSLAYLVCRLLLEKKKKTNYLILRLFLYISVYLCFCLLF